MTLDEKRRVAIAQGNVANKIAFLETGLSRNGVSFMLIKEPQHTKEDVTNAKRWLRNRRDVTHIQVTTLE